MTKGTCYMALRRDSWATPQEDKLGRITSDVLTTVDFFEILTSSRRPDVFGTAQDEIREQGRGMPRPCMIYLNASTSF